MRRAILGVFAVLFLAGGIAGLATYGTNDSTASALSSVGVRAGALLGALWLALPQLEALFRRFPPWFLASIAGAALVVIVRPRLLIYVLPFLAILAVLRFCGWILQPFSPQTSGKKSSGDRSDDERRSIKG